MASNKTTVQVLGLKKVMSALRKEIISELRSKETRAGIADIVIEAIQENKTPVTSQITKDFREYFEQFNRTDPKYSRSQINMTFTGQLLKDLKSNVRLQSIKGSGYAYIFQQSEKTHKGYKFRSSGGTFGGEIKSYKSGSKIGQQKKGKSGTTEKLAFSKISELLIKRGYNYLDIKAETLTKADEFIQNRLSIRLRKYLSSQG